MKMNVGKMDRALRVVVGLLLLSLVFTVEGSLRWIGLIGIVPLATGALGWCPAYSLFGITSNGPFDRTGAHGT